MTKLKTLCDASRGGERLLEMSLCLKLGARTVEQQVSHCLDIA
jgi:hypothetical protein